MNKERMLILASVLNGAGLPSDFKFSMPNYYMNPDAYSGTVCKTSGCIAGLAVHMFGDRRNANQWGTHKMAKKILGLTQREADDLFLGEIVPNKLRVKHERVKNVHASKVCAYAAKTGKIDWKKAGPLPTFNPED